MNNCSGRTECRVVKSHAQQCMLNNSKKRPKKKQNIFPDFIVMYISEKCKCVKSKSKSKVSLSLLVPHDLIINKVIDVFKISRLHDRVVVAAIGKLLPYTDISPRSSVEVLHVLRRDKLVPQTT